MKKIFLFAAIILLLFTILGFRLIESGFARLTSDFKTLPSDNRILYEIGAENIAIESAKYFSKAISIVEMRQLGTFKAPVKVYVFASANSFSKYSGASEKVKGACWENDIFLSGKLLNLMSETQGILTHELSHVQLLQTLGSISFNNDLPRWFREGLAIYVADGGGAMNASEAESIRSFKKGAHFLPEVKGSLFSKKLTGTVDLEPKIFYRQSGMFVKFMAANYPSQFETFVKDIQEGNEFGVSFVKSFKIDIDEMLKIYISTLTEA